jgi:tripartite ATP-independent transporter DctP family solute receptor
MKVSVFAGGVLGGDAPTVSSLQGGTIPLVLLNSGILASQVKDFVVFDFPFMFANEKEADAAVDGPFGKSMHAKLESKGIVGLTFFELGFRNITNSKRPIAKVEDIAGLKLRVIPNAINIDWVKALGGNPTPLAFPEVYAAMEQKAIDGQENPLSVILANKFAEVQKYLTITNHQYNPQSLIFSKKIWDTLSAPERKILQDAALEAAVFQRQVSREAATTTLDALKKAGMQVSEFSPAEQEKLRGKLKPVIDKHGAEISETVKALEAELSKLR